MRRLLIGLGALVLLSGCGGGGGSSSPAGQTSSGAGMIPESAPAVIAVNTDFDGGQVKALRDLLNKLPGKAKIYAQLRQALASQGADFERDVKPAIGPETDLVFLNLENGISGAVAITKPPNKAKFQALAAKGDNTQKTADLEDGWMAAADSEALLTRYQELAKKGKLADSGTYKDATANLPGDALAKVFVDGSTLSSLLKKRGLGSAPVVGGNLDWVSGALKAESKGLALDIKVHGDKISTGAYSAGLLKEIPAGALALLSFNDQRGTIEKIAGSPQLRGQASQIEAAAGVSLEKIAALFGGEGALYVRRGSPLPEITLALEPPNRSEALSTVKTLAKRLGRLLGGGKSSSTSISGVTATRLDLGRFAIYFAGFGNKVVVTDATTGISGLRAGGQKLADDPVFKQVADAAGMPDKTAGFLYLNLKDGVSLIKNFADLAGQDIPSSITDNLPALQAFVLYGSTEGNTLSLKGFLQFK